jgi:hypothetical protein
METFEYSSVKDLHTDIQARIQAHKIQDPMAGVVLVTDSPLQGLLLRRQLVESSKSLAVGNIQVKMIDEVIADVFRSMGVTSGAFPSEAALDAACYSAMLTNAIFASAGSEALTTANGIANVYSKLRFNTDAELESLLLEKLSDTQKAVIESVIAARDLLHSKLGVEKLPEKIEEIISAIKANGLPANLDNSYLVLSENIPKLVSNLLQLLPSAVRYEISPIEPMVKAANVYFTTPDPQTEAALAVSQIVDLIDGDTHPFDIAIAYSNGQQYARLLGAALDDAEIAWNGTVETISQVSSLYRGFDLILQMLDKRTTVRSGADRPLVMRLLESGDFYIDDQLLNSNLCRQFVRDKEIYGDAVSWLKVIDKLPNPSRPRELKAAVELRALLKTLQKSLQNLSEAATWTDFGQELFAVVSSFYLGVNEENLSDEEKNVVKMFKQVLLQELPELDLLKPDKGDGLLPSATVIRSFIDRKIGQKNSRHGALSVGVHVASIQELRVLNFKKLILVGATDGFLPPSSNEMPFLTDQMLDTLGELGRVSTAATDKPAQLGRQLAALVDGKNLIITRSRSAMVGKLDDVPSRYLPKTSSTFPEATVVNSFSSLHSTNSDFIVSSKDLQEISHSLSDNEALDQAAARTLAALSIFRAPTNQGYFGKINHIPDLHSLGSNALSASAIEAFIDCEYKFFVTRTLGFYTGERQDTLDIWRAKDFGNLIHNSMENFLNDLADRKELPEGQAHFTDAQVETFFSDHLAEELKAFYAKGHDVWRSGFEALMDRVKANLRDFFKTESATLRATNNLAVHAAELAFGKEEPEKDRTQLPVPGRKPVGLVGRIDRVDMNESQTMAGVLDFKSGKLKKSEYEKKIGKPKSKEPNKGLVQREKVQDLVYTVTLRQKFPSLTNVDVTFAFISSGTKTEYVKAEWAEPAEDKLAAIVEQIFVAEDKAEFPVTHSNKIGENTYCDVCQRLGWVAEQLRLDYVNQTGLIGGGDEDE